MIHSFEEKNLEKLFTSGKSQSGLPTDITNSLKRALNELHAAGSEADLIRLKSRSYEKIHHTRLRERERAGDMSSIRVSSKYRLLFTWANGGANRVKLTAHAHA
ncbi:plasmid maintenance system killer family protein [Klebsiella pneumoniae]|uniref:type II toxin-antitoxin system RelE/ParE family toxin n=1 Tax=Klebsiella pneumoniae complex TaxID=3390273 RepID=UPI00073C416B|nr:type II toxin-antitoxin system RelE/ParE family toxin [Klebsiella pneumoniae]AQV33773.1 plasmid maintenance system killer family protein [Escherichia coli]EFO2042192.1 plasmid maintenance system killer family protein [Escherichia coli]KSZ32343.1 plasmid maintenance system killer family protein [Klebsiella pneumoniae]MBZ6810865.1 plasmid maintenance system killer family protein [Klebsiella pneumoniae]MBZ7162005.1 plasmid maintenance system killer family protein [Klebsiella pneumoniae]